MGKKCKECSKKEQGLTYANRQIAILNQTIVSLSYDLRQAQQEASDKSKVLRGNEDSLYQVVRDMKALSNSLSELGAYY